IFERYTACVSGWAKDLAPRGVDLDHAALRIDRHESGREAAGERGRDALEIIGALFLQIVHALQFRFLLTQGDDRLSKGVDEILLLVAGWIALLELRGGVQHPPDRFRD